MTAKENGEKDISIRQSKKRDSTKSNSHLWIKPSQLKQYQRMDRGVISYQSHIHVNFSKNNFQFYWPSDLESRSRSKNFRWRVFLFRCTHPVSFIKIREKKKWKRRRIIITRQELGRRRSSKPILPSWMVLHPLMLKRVFLIYASFRP